MINVILLLGDILVGGNTTNITSSSLADIELYDYEIL